MTRTEHLLFLVAEECAELAQRASKTARFGVDEVWAGQPLTNSQLMMDEYADLIAVMEKLCLMIDPSQLPTSKDMREKIDLKKKKIEVYLEYSRSQGTLTE